MAHPQTFASRTVSRNNRAFDSSIRGRTFPRGGGNMATNRRSTTFGPFGNVFSRSGPGTSRSTSGFDPTNLIEPGINLLAQLFGGGGDTGAGGRAAAAETGGNQQAIDQLIKQLGLSRLDVDPNIQAGQRALAGVEEGSTVGGLESRLSRIADTDVFSTIARERGLAAQSQLAPRGQTFSGEGARAAAEVPTDLLLQLEELLTRRQTGLAGSGQNAALGFGALNVRAGGNIGDLFSRSGVSQGAGILTDAQAGAAQSQQTLNTVAAFGRAFF